MALAFGVVRLGYVYGDYPLDMTRNDLRALLERRFRASEKVEREPPQTVVVLAYRPQSETDQSVNEAVLGSFQALPAKNILRYIEVGNGPIEAAGEAIGIISGWPKPASCRRHR